MAYMLNVNLVVMVPTANAGTLDTDLIADWPADAPQPTARIIDSTQTEVAGEMQVEVDLASVGVTQADIAATFAGAMAALASTGATLVNGNVSFGPPPPVPAAPVAA